MRVISPALCVPPEELIFTVRAAELTVMSKLVLGGLDWAVPVISTLLELYCRTSTIWAVHTQARLRIATATMTLFM